MKISENSIRRIKKEINPISNESIHSIRNSVKRVLKPMGKVAGTALLLSSLLGTVASSKADDSPIKGSQREVITNPTENLKREKRNN
ncbi:hypothetical protein JW758_01680 [Candidatus Peregrinibacteria bacterium]|nr:hypothetical protein [Candidatus Peregrinibacteria bacterium]